MATTATEKALKQEVDRLTLRVEELEGLVAALLATGSEYTARAVSDALYQVKESAVVVAAAMTFMVDDLNAATAVQIDAVEQGTYLRDCLGLN